MLSTLIRSKSRVKVLTLFLTHPDERFYYTQLFGLLPVPHSALQKELKALVNVGLLETSKEATIRYYWVNKAYPLYPELKSIVFKTAGLADFLRDSLEEIGPVEVALIYGSVAKNVEDMRSDVDVLVIGDIDTDALHEAIDTAEQAISREINSTVYTRKEWAGRVKIQQAFATDILSGPKIFLIGDEDELRRTP